MPVFVAALGYFVDVYDLLLFTIVRQPSVLAVGSSLETILVDSAHIINWQMSGLLIGGILWGVVGDKLGRLKVLFGSILLYSVANIITGYVQTVDQYAYCRFIGGIGLAGELGAGITLVSEMLPKIKEGLVLLWWQGLVCLALSLLILHLSIHRIGGYVIKLEAD